MSDQTHHPRLPRDFRLGTGTSAYQVEGAITEDGRGASIWDTFCAEPGTIADGTSGALACDHYHRVDDDVALLRDLGAGGYRFSIAWPRIQPDGTGPVNHKGLDFYGRLVDKLLTAGVEPMATLFQWDLPQTLEDDGGWLNRATADRFADYALLVGDRLADRVEHWIPVDAPSVVTTLGYAVGFHAPGRVLTFDAMPVAHHLLLAHGRAVSALREVGASSVGCANLHSPIWPASDGQADQRAAHLFDTFWNHLYIEAMLRGRYPADLKPMLAGAIRPGDMATIRQPLDFYGVTYYMPFRIGAAHEDAPMPFELYEIADRPTTDLLWPIAPEALRDWLVCFHAGLRAAAPPIYVTGCGGAFNVGPDADGTVDDQARIDYHAGHLSAVAEAIRLGVDVRGYYAWSLLDGFEWTQGRRARYGLVHVDYETQRRTKKRSFHWYADLVTATRHGDTS